METSPQQKFASRLVYRGKGLLTFDQRPYLPAIYQDALRKNLVIRASRQVEKSTMLAVSILYWAATSPGTQILYVSPRQDQAYMFSLTRLIPFIEDSSILRAALIGNSKRRLPLKTLKFKNGSCVHVRAAYHSADAVRGISADVLLVDEFQDSPPDQLPVLRETLSHSAKPRVILCGTPKLIDGPLDAMFSQSTANEWQVKCTHCGHDAILDESSIGPNGIICVKCQTPLDKFAGRWVPRNPEANWAGYWINALMVPWKKNFEDILESQRTYDFARFRNEVIGLPVTLGDHIVTRAQMEACCTATPMSQSVADVPRQFRDQIVAGVDWGGGGSARTAVVIGYLNAEGAFEVCHFARIHEREDSLVVRDQVVELCRRFKARWIGADGLGNGSVYNRLLLSDLKHPTSLYAIGYSGSDSKPVQDGILWKWSVSKTGSIGHLFACIQKLKLRFPRVADCGTFLDEFVCEVAEYDEDSRTVRYTHPATQPDDCLHACNYALLMATRLSLFLAGKCSDD